MTKEAFNLAKALKADPKKYSLKMWPSDDPTEDMVNSPPHYNASGIECIDAIQAATEDGFEYYLQGNIMKYLWRYRYKNGNEDLKKARWYLDKLIEVRDAS